MSKSGGLLELVARGKKDVFFTANPSVSFFHSVYVKAAPITKEIYVANPRNSPEWGKWVDFDIDHRGDILKHTYLRISLPSWLPLEVHNANKTGLVTYDLSGTTFGYCNNIGYQIIDKIQFFQDQVLLQEYYGEYLDWRLRQSYKTSTILVVAGQGGTYEETPIGIGRSASPRTVRVPIPILGWESLQDQGLPLAALRGQRFRIRVHVRKLEDVIVASDGRLFPNPFNKKLYVQTKRDGPIDTSFKTLTKASMKNLNMSLETTQVYTNSDVHVFLKAQTIRFPFRTIQFQQYTIEDNIMNAASMNPQGIFNFPLSIDCIGSINRMLIGFRSEASTQAGQRLDLRSPVTQDRYINTMRLNIANIDRIKQWPMELYREVTSYWKNQRTAFDLVAPSHIQEVYTVTFGGYDANNPSGTMNFTRVTNPVLHLTLNAIEYDPRNISRKVFALMYAESWNIYQVSNGKGKLMFDDS